MVTLSPPTDNLYKFLALFGLAVVLSSGGAAVAMMGDRADAERQFQINSLVALREATRLLESSDSLDNKRADAILDSLEKAIDNRELAQERDEESPSPLLPLLWIMVVAGAAVSAFGFRKWHQLQRRLDTKHTPQSRIFE